MSDRPSEKASEPTLTSEAAEAAFLSWWMDNARFVEAGIPADYLGLRDALNVHYPEKIEITEDMVRAGAEALLWHSAPTPDDCYGAARAVLEAALSEPKDRR